MAVVHDEVVEMLAGNGARFLGFVGELAWGTFARARHGRDGGVAKGGECSAVCCGVGYSQCRV